MSVDALLDLLSQEKPASDALDPTADSDFELDLRITDGPGENPLSIINLPTITRQHTDNRCTCPCPIPGYGC